MRKYLIFIGISLLCACGPRGGKTVSTPSVRDFPRAEVPAMYADMGDRIIWASTHFWDRFTDTTRLYACDSVTVNGVTRDNVEEQMGIFVTLAEQLSVDEGGKAVARLYDRIDAFERKYPDSNVFEELCEMTRRYLYDPNSPVRDEDLYGAFVERLAGSDLIDPAYRKGYAWDARMCRLNRVGTKAADFSFTDTNGRLRTLYGIQAEYTVLIFGNPGCHACQEIMEAMSASPEITALIASGRIKVVDVYIDEDLDDWMAHIPEYPASWINGYDQDYHIRGDLLYNVRGIPSVYLLDANKTVLMKDAPQEKVLEELGRM